MADESPQEKEERLQKQEERLQKQHNRLKERAALPKGGGSSSASVGKGLGDFAGFFGEHKIVMFVIGGVVVLAAIIFYINQSGNGNSTGTTSSNTPTDLANAGYQDAGTAYALDQVTQELQSLQQQINNPPAQPTSPTPPPKTTTPPPRKPGPPGHPLPKPASHNYTYDYSNGHQTLANIAQVHHISLSRIEALNQTPYVKPGVVLHYGYRVRVK